MSEEIFDVVDAHIPRHRIRIPHNRPLLLRQQPLLTLPLQLLAPQDLQTGITHPAGFSKRSVMRPFVPRLVDDCDATDGYLADVVGQGGLRADGAQEGVPAVGDGW